MSKNTHAPTGQAAAWQAIAFIPVPSDDPSMSASKRIALPGIHRCMNEALSAALAYPQAIGGTARRIQPEGGDS